MHHSYNTPFRPTCADFVEIETDDQDCYVVACVLQTLPPPPLPLARQALPGAATALVSRDAATAYLLSRQHCDDLAELHEQFELA